VQVDEVCSAQYLLKKCKCPPELAEEIDVDTLRGAEGKEVGEYVDILVKLHKKMNKMKAKSVITQAKKLKQADEVREALVSLGVGTLPDLASSDADTQKKVQTIFDEVCNNRGILFTKRFRELKATMSLDSPDTLTAPMLSDFSLSLMSTSLSHTAKALFVKTRSHEGNPMVQASYAGDITQIEQGSEEQMILHEAAAEEASKLAECDKRQVRIQDDAAGEGNIVVRLEFLPSASCCAETAAAKYTEKITAMACKVTSINNSMRLLPKETLEVLGETGAIEAFASLPQKKADGEEVTIFQCDDKTISCTIVRPLGEGAQGWVYEVKSDLVADGKTRALKCASFSATIHNALILLRLNSHRSHRNVLQVDSVYSPIDKLELLCMMETVGGPEDTVRDLEQATQSKILYQGSAADISARLLSLAVQLAFAIEFIHGCGVVHQDIKPANLLLDVSQWRLVLADFGVASHGQDSPDGSVNGAETKGCTPRFCSREVLQNYREAMQSGKQTFCSHSTDIWCFASTLLHLYQGGESAFPLHTLSAKAINESLSNTKIPLPEGLRKVLHRILLENSDGRMTSKDLADTMQQLPGASVRPPFKQGIEKQRLSIIHSNLGLALQSRGQLIRAQEQYKYAIEMDSSQVQRIVLFVTNADDLEPRLLWNAMQNKLREIGRLLGGDQPVGCHIAVSEDSTITIDIIRASLWDQLTQAALITDVGFLQVLRDQILGGDFEADLEKGLQQLNSTLLQHTDEKKSAEKRKKHKGKGKRKKGQDGEAEQGQDDEDCMEEEQEEQEEEKGSLKITVDKGHFAEMYERSMLMLKTLTPHQSKVLKECSHEENGKLAMSGDVHIRAAAGAGKTFVALHICLRYLEGKSESAHVLFVAQNEALAYFVAKWVYTRTQDQSILDRFHVLYGAELKRGKFRVDTNAGCLVLEEIGSSECFEYSLLVVDEAHHVFSAFPTSFFADQYISGSASGSSSGSVNTTRRLLLSDISQSVLLTDYLAAAGANDMKEVVLNEVVRSSERIVEGARSFQTNDDDVPTKCHHRASGPPLKTFLFDPQLDNSARMEQYATKVREAMTFLQKQFTGMGFHDRVAIVASSTAFIEELKPLLLVLLGSGFDIIDAAAANRCISTGGSGQKMKHAALNEASASKISQCLVLDTVDNFTGLERLIVIAIGLDTHIDGSTKASQARSQLYRCITRAQMMVVVVNEVVHGGWLGFLPHLDFDPNTKFDAQLERNRNATGAARKILQEKSQQQQQQQQKQHEEEKKGDDDGEEEEGNKRLRNNRDSKPEKKYKRQKGEKSVEVDQSGLISSPGGGSQHNNRNQDEMPTGVQCAIWDISGNEEGVKALDNAFMPIANNVQKVHLLRCKLSGWQNVIYKQFTTEFRQQMASMNPQRMDEEDEEEERRRISGFGLQQLRNICNHPYLLIKQDYNQHSAQELQSLLANANGELVRSSGKFELLDRILPKLKHADHRVLMCCETTFLMTILEDYFKYRNFRYFRIDGLTSRDDREQFITQFNTPDSPHFIFMFSARAMSVMIKLLTTADTVIYFDAHTRPQYSQKNKVCPLIGSSQLRPL
jgi:serine/threonine protein kinase